MILKYVLSLLLSYLLGSTSLAVLIGYTFYNRDVSREGSGNLGATNVARSFGLLPAIETLLWDMGKCFLSFLIGRKLGGELGAALAVGACLLGHCFPCFHRFKGGKGVACSSVAAFAVSPLAGLVAIGAFLLTALLSRRVSAGSLAGAAGLAVSAVFFGDSLPMKILGVFTGVLIAVMHRANIQRLLKGTEPLFRLNR